MPGLNQVMIKHVGIFASFCGCTARRESPGKGNAKRPGSLHLASGHRVLKSLCSAQEGLSGACGSYVCGSYVCCQSQQCDGGAAPSGCLPGG